MTWEQIRERRREMAELVRAGKAITEVASKYDVTRQTVRLACLAHGVPTTGKPGPKTGRGLYPILARLFQPGTFRQCATELGVSANRVLDVYQAARKAGIPVPQRGYIPFQPYDPSKKEGQDASV
jgi:hypothetical protein